MLNPVYEEKIIPRHLDLFCRADDGVKSTTTKLDSGSAMKNPADMAYASKYNGLNKNTIDERKSSSSSDSFMGDARRLSEAGVRRSSGNSVVLTEDTDKFIIGNRIWVGGTKPGQIAYIGETNFGNGDWAGIVLDEPIGKNDGSVGGTRYFQCEPKKGIFARLTNLTSTPLSPVEDSMIQSSFAATKPLGFSTPMPKRQASTLTAPKSISHQPTISKSSSDLKIGDRVIISSGQGSKLGVLKYRGFTQFAPGEWCGIELDDPVGKNNGSVEGIQYFECEDKFGLFAPIAKVSKSPMSASRMSTNCAVHKSKRSPGSMNGSMVSGITSTTMSSIPTPRQTKVSDLDRLKLQLTQMKNENELLRSQVTKAANQADVAERRLDETLKAQVHKPSETEINCLANLQIQVDNMKKQMDEEKEKIQNLQFTNEEQNVANIELQNKNAELLIKIKELEFDLDKERNLTKDVEKETMKIFEKEEELCRIKEELESLKKVINNNEDELQKSVSNLSSEVVDKEAVLNSLRQTLNENSQTHDRLLKEANEKLFATTEKLNKVIEERDKKIEQNQEMIDQLNEGIKCLSALKNEEHDDIVNNLNNELSKLKEEYKVIIDKKEQDNKIFKENFVKIENELREELKSLLESKNQEIELQNINTDLMSQISSQKDDIEKLKLQLHVTSENLKELKTNNLMYSKETLKLVLEQQMKLTYIKVEDFKKDVEKSISLKNKQIETCNARLIKINEQLLNSKSCLEITFNDKINKKDDEIMILSEKLNTMTKDLEKLEKNKEDVSLELSTALKSVQEKIAIIADLEKKYNKLNSQQELNRNELEKELNAQLKSVNDELGCLKLEKSALEEKHDNFIKTSENATIEMDSKLEENNLLIENLNKSLKELTLSKQNELDSLEKRLLQLEEEREQVLKHQHLELATKDEIINTLTSKLEETLTEKQKQDLNNANLHTELTHEITNYQTSIKDLQNKINELELIITSNQESFIKDLELSNNEKEKSKLENVNLLEKCKSLESSKLNLEEKLDSFEVCKQDIQNLNDAIKEKNKTIDDYQMKLKQFDSLIVQTKNEFEVALKDKEEEIRELSKIGEEKMKIEKLSLEEKTKFILNEKERENSILLKKVEDLENIKIRFENQLEVNELQEQDLKKLNENLQQKIKMIENNDLKIGELNNLILLNQNEFKAKLQKKEIEIIELLKTEEEKLHFEKNQMEKQTNAMLDEKNIENSSLLDKIKSLENTNTSVEQQLEINKTQENLIMEYRRSIEEKTKIIDDNNSKIEELNRMILISKEEFNNMLKDKEEKAKEFIKTEEQKLNDEKLILEKNTKTILDNKETEISNLVEKLNNLESIKLNLEKQLEVSKTQEHEITELTKKVEEKSKVIDDTNLKVEQLNSLIAQIKEDFDMKLKNKENEIEELVKVGEDKLNIEKATSEKHIKKSLDEKNTEIEVLKTKLQEFVENNSEKELMLKLESVVDELEKEKIRVSSLEVLKSELTKTVLDHKTELELLEVSKMNMKADMTKNIEEQQRLYGELNAKIKAESEQLGGENLQIQKQIEELKSECSRLQSILNEKDHEIENLKTQVSQKLKTTDFNNDELNKLKALREKDRSSQSHLEFRIQELTDENHRLNERIEGDVSLLQKNHNIIQEKYNLERKFEETYSMLKIKENQVLVLQTELNSWKLKDMGKSKNDNTKEKSDKTETHLLAEKNEEIKLLNSIIMGLHKKLSAVMETDVSEFEIEKNPSAVSKDDYQKLYKTAKNNVKLKECENLSLKQEMYKLKTEIERYSDLKTKCESLENDKKTLQKLIVNYESSHPSGENSDSKSETSKILEEKDWQINLLNNIIAGLHSKVSDNKFKIEALEKQILDSGVDQNKKVRIRTTRLYCEQCEIFDSHDTEDCPEKPESPKFQRKRRVVNDNVTEEPFCVCCDMFGHTANECDSSLTF